MPTYHFLLIIGICNSSTGRAGTIHCSGFGSFRIHSSPHVDFRVSAIIRIRTSTFITSVKYMMSEKRRECKQKKEQRVFEILVCIYPSILFPVLYL